MSLEILPGQKYNRLTVVELTTRRSSGARLYLCNCTCGGTAITKGSSLKSGKTKSCGCLRDETAATIGSSRRKPGGTSALNNIFVNYKRHARLRGFEWYLSKEQFQDLTLKDCAYCGSKPSNISKGFGSSDFDYVYNGLDRVDSTGDYTEDNVVPCCKRCNIGKSDMTREDFLSWIKRVATFSNV